jgi:hypothetical protein
MENKESWLIEDTGMTKFYSTREAAIRIGIPVQRLQTAAWRGTVPLPKKSPSGDFLWTDCEIKTAKNILFSNRRRQSAITA